MSYNWENKTERAQQARIHTEVMEKLYSEEIQQSAEDTIIYVGQLREFTHPKPVETHVSIIPVDSVTAASYSRSPGTCVLNFASFKNPGGMFLEGSRAQEECLCMESNLYNILKELDEIYYSQNRGNTNRALYYDKALYTPNVIFHGSSADEFRCSVLTCAAPNVKAAKRYCNVSEAENQIVLKARIKFILDIAEKEKVDTLILGAFGCGVFGQNPEKVAAIFIEEVRHRGFESVVYAIPPGPNYDAFVEVLDRHM